MSQWTITMPGNARPFPGAKVGDRLWAGELSEGFAEYIIVRLLPNDFVGVVCTGSKYELDFYPHVATGEYYRSLAEAVMASANGDVDYHAPRLRFAHDALDAVNAGSDLSRFFDGYDHAIADAEGK